MKGKTLAIGIAFVTVAVAIIAISVAYAPQLLVKRKAMEKIRSQLVDPSSAEFRNLRVVKGRKGIDMVCGEVNAKNKLGGYVGFKDFYFEDEENGVVLIDPGPDALVLPGILWWQHKEYCK